MCGAVHSVVLQNAETVKLVCSHDGQPPPASSASGSSSDGEERGGALAGSSGREGNGAGGGGRRAQAQEGGGGPPRAWSAVSVSELQPGKHQVLVHMPSAGPARHTGLPVEEWVVEH